jgi:hypothetical protein
MENNLANDDYSDLPNMNFTNEKEFNKEIDNIMELTKDISADWRKREDAIKRLGGVILSNYGCNSSFIKHFNLKICLNLSVQLVDLRSSLMKEACRIVMLAARTYNEKIESAADKLISPLVLYKLVGSANKLISETGSHCIIEMIKHIESGKIIIRIHEQVKNKSNTVRLRAGQQLLYIVSNYSKNTISKNISQIEEFIQISTHDANMDVRACGRKIFLKYLEISSNAAQKLFTAFENNVQKTINEEIKENEQQNLRNSNLSKYQEQMENGYSSTFSSTGPSKMYNSNINYINKTPIQNKNDLINTYNNAQINLSKSLNPHMNNIALSNNNLSSTNFSNTYTKRKPSENFEFSPDRTTTNSVSKPLQTNISKQIKQISKTESKSIINRIGKMSIDKDSEQNLNLQTNNVKNYQNNYYSTPTINKNLPQQIPQQEIVENFVKSPIVQKEKPKLNNIEDVLKNNINIINSEKDISTKLYLFEQISNLFNEIYSNIDYISKQTLQNLINLHINHISESYYFKLTIAVIKNLIKFIYYLDDIFTTEQLQKITKYIVISLASDKEEVVNNAQNFYEILRKKVDSNIIIKPVIEIVKNQCEGEILSTCLELLGFLVDLAVSTLSDQDYMNGFIKTLCDILCRENGGNSIQSKVCDLLEGIYKKYPKQFLSGFVNLNKTFDFKTFEYVLNIISNEKKIIYEYLASSLSSNYKININKPINKFSEQKMISKNSNSKISMPLCLSSNAEISTIAAQHDYSSFLSYLKSDPTANFENFLLSLDKIKYESALQNLNHIKNLLLDDQAKNILDDSLQLLIEKIIFLYEKFYTEFSDILKDILSLIPDRLDKELYLQIIPEYLNPRQSPHLVQILLVCVKNTINSIEPENLLLLLPSFIESIYSTLNHQISDVRKIAVYLIVDLSMILGRDFDVYINQLNISQKNLINIYIKKKSGESSNGSSTGSRK